MHVEIKPGKANPDESYVNLIGGNGEIIWPSESHNRFFARRKAKRLAKIMGIRALDFTRADGAMKVIYDPEL